MMTSAILLIPTKDKIFPLFIYIMCYNFYKCAWLMISCIPSARWFENH